MNDHVEWERIPSSIRDAVIQGHTGPIRKVQSIASPRPGATLRVYGEKQDMFLKAIPLTDNTRQLYERERWAGLNLPPDAPVPRMVWNAIIERWLVLAWELINDHAEHAYLAPDSTDAELVLEAMQRLGKLPCPDGARPVADLVTELRTRADAMLDLPPTELRGRDLYMTALESFDAEALDGQALLHGDLSPWHLRIKDDAVHVVDWSQACQGAAYVDLAFFAPHLVEARHSCEHADAMLSSLPGWTEAPAAQLAGLAALWTLAHLERAANGPKHRRPSEIHLANAGREWLASRL
ncbi:hypothetical protein [Nonomuraea sp. NPDC049400]|uniref:hypothetical protein n=1 Tax=Nonomuraea sp. NPDC049400 TaxID=3364352 RepID=UPI003792BC66